MVANIGTSQSSLNERKLQEKLRTTELSLKSLNDRSSFTGGDHNWFFMVGCGDMKHFGEFCDA